MINIILSIKLFIYRFIHTPIGKPIWWLLAKLFVRAPDLNDYAIEDRDMYGAPKKGMKKLYDKVREKER